MIELEFGIKCQVIREQFPLVSGQNPYTIGYGGDFNTSRPMKIIDAYLLLNNGSIPVSYPMQVLGYDDYNAVRLKTLAALKFATPNASGPAAALSHL